MKIKNLTIFDLVIFIVVCIFINAGVEYVIQSSRHSVSTVKKINLKIDSDLHLLEKNYSQPQSNAYGIITGNESSASGQHSVAFGSSNTCRSDSSYKQVILYITELNYLIKQQNGTKRHNYQP